MSTMYNEEFEKVEQYGATLLKKWHKAINQDGGIADQQKAITTAILLENYMNYLNGDPSLIMEDQIQSNSFQGVNLALLGLIRRTIPEIVGAELVGMQAMPTPESPLFYLVWEKFLSNDANLPGAPGTNFKGSSANGDELWGTPLPAGSLGTDPFYTSSQVRNADVEASGLVVGGSAIAAGANTIKLNWAPVLSGTIKLTAVAYAANGSVVSQGEVHLGGSYYESAYAGDVTAYGTLAITAVTWDKNTTQVGFTLPALPAGATDYKVFASWEYNQEGNPRQPELSMKIKRAKVNLVRRQLRGRFTLDSITDARVLHGISIENELFEMMKVELTNEINREILRDLRLMAAFRREINYNNLKDAISGNYEDMHRIVLDAINMIRSEIWNVGRLGMANFVVANPVSLSWISRVPGFVGSGVSFDASRGLTYVGAIGTLKFYYDPQYPVGELLIGYKGPSTLDTGYIHAPYLPITATPTMYNNLTGDPIKIFYTRYGKTFKDIDPESNGLPTNAIYRGEYQYATLKLVNFPFIGPASFYNGFGQSVSGAPQVSGSSVPGNQWPGVQTTPGAII